MEFLRRGPSKTPAAEMTDRSRTKSPMATPGRGGGGGEESPATVAEEGLGRKTPKGRFSNGKWDSRGTSTKDLSPMATYQTLLRELLRTQKLERAREGKFGSGKFIDAFPTACAFSWTGTRRERSIKWPINRKAGWMREICDDG